MGAQGAMRESSRPLEAENLRRNFRLHLSAKAYEPVVKRDVQGAQALGKANVGASGAQTVEY